MGQDIFEKASQLWKMEAYTLRRMAEVVNPEAFTQIVSRMGDTVRRGGRILVIGKGASGIAARKLVHNLCSLEIPAIFMSAGEGKHATLGLLKSGDMLVLISKGGSTDELVQLIEPARDKGVTVLGVTQNPASMLGMKCDLLLRIMVVKEVNIADQVGNASSIALIAILDALCDGIINYLYSVD